MAEIPSKTICLHVAVNERGDHFLSEASAEEALQRLIVAYGGRAFRLVDVDLSILFAAPEEARPPSRPPTLRILG